MQDISIITDNIETIKEMAVQGDADAQNKIGFCYHHGIAGFPVDYEAAVRWYLKAAEQGLAKAQSNLACCYLNGEGVEQDSKKAVDWYTKAAYQGNAVAQYQLGWCYSEGDGIDKDLVKAVDCFRKAAEQGHAKAQLDLGYRYETGKGVQTSPQKAFEWYEKSAIQGNHIAQTNLGYCYESSIGIERDNKKAAEWYSKAAEQGNARAMNNLGFLYEKGKGVEKDYVKAFDLYIKAAKQNFVSAFTNLGYCYENGIGTKKDYKSAEDWYTKAAEKGDEYASSALKRVKENIEKEGWMKSLNFSTRQRIKDTVYSRVIPIGKNFIVKRNRLWGIVDKDNTILLPIEYTRVHWFHGNYAGIQFNNKWGLVNSKGVITIEPQYDTLYYLSQHKACDVEIGDERFVVDVNNNPILKINGKRVRFEGNKLLVFSKEGCQLYNLDGTPFSKIHSHIHNYDEYFMGYDGDEDSEETLIKANGEEVKLPKYEHSVFHDHITQFRYQNKYGIIDDNGTIVVPNQYDYITLGSGVIAINEGNESKDNDNRFLAYPFEGVWYFWNYEYQEITPYSYEDFKSTYKHGDEEKVWFAKREGLWYQITPNGEELFANNESEFKKKRAAIERERNKKSEGKFAIYGDPNYKEDGHNIKV